MVGAHTRVHSAGGHSLVPTTLGRVDATARLAARDAAVASVRIDPRDVTEPRSSGKPFMGATPQTPSSTQETTNDNYEKNLLPPPELPSSPHKEERADADLRAKG